MQTIGIFHTKGGVGKSAVAVFLADFLSSLHENRVLLVDLDPQGSCSRAIVPEETLAAAFAAGRSLPRLLTAAFDGTLDDAAVEAAIVTRPMQGRRRRGSVPLGEVGLLATESNDYRSFRDRLLEVPKQARKGQLPLLRKTLDRVAANYDLAIIDFPGSEIPFWTLMGIRATDQWLLPEIPDYVSAAALEGTNELLQQVGTATGHIPKPLGTLLTICPRRGSGVYKKTRAALGHLEKQKIIPTLFPKDTEILHRPEAQKALDWEAEKAKTLVNRYGSTTSPFHVGLRKLANEVLRRLGRPAGGDKLSFVADLRRRMTDYWR